MAGSVDDMQRDLAINDTISQLLGLFTRHQPDREDIEACRATIAERIAAINARHSRRRRVSEVLGSASKVITQRTAWMRHAHFPSGGYFGIITENDRGRRTDKIFKSCAVHFDADHTLSYIGFTYTTNNHKTATVNALNLTRAMLPDRQATLSTTSRYSINHWAIGIRVR